MITLKMNENENNENPAEQELPEEEGAPLTEITHNILFKLNELMPCLDANNIISTIMFNEGHEDMPPEKYNLIAQRYKDANVAVSSVDFETGKVTDKNIASLANYEQRLTDIAAWCLIDLREHITKDLTGDEQKKAMETTRELLEFLKYAGYTKTNPNFKIPSRN